MDMNEQNKHEPLLTISPSAAVPMAIVMVIVLGVTMIAWGWVPHLSLLLVIIGLMMFGLVKGVKFDAMQDKMISGVGAGMGAIYLFSFIGLLVSALMMSGAIPTLIYYGFGVLSADMFYLSAFILSSIVGIALGSGFTTCATIGVAFLGMAAAFVNFRNKCHSFEINVTFYDFFKIFRNKCHLFHPVFNLTLR